MRPCANHPDRPALALCKSCGKAVCQECTTTWEGIYYCGPCLREKRGAKGGGGSLLSWLVMLAAAALLFFASNALRPTVGAVFGGWF